MTSPGEWLKEMEIEALKSARNLHRHFVKYLLGQITWDEFISVCRLREAEFEKRIRVKKEQ